MASTVRMPKVELHVHLDGAFDAGVLHRAAKACLADGKLSEHIAAKVSECGDDVEAFTKLVSCHPEDQSLKAMIDRFVFFLTFVQGNLPIIEELACAFVSRQAAQNVLYTEVRYSPHIMTSVGTYDGDAGANASGSDDMHAQAQAVVEAVTRGLRRGCEKHPGTEITQILCFLDGKVEWIDSLMQIASTGRAASAAASALPFGAQPLETCPIVGVDIAAGEDHFVPAASTTVNGVWCENGASQSENSAKHRQALRKCREMGLGITNHAGETGIAANVSAAVSDAYGRATRIGHGSADCHGLPRIASLIRELPASATGPLIATDCHGLHLSSGTLQWPLRSRWRPRPRQTVHLRGRRRWRRRSTRSD